MPAVISLKLILSSAPDAAIPQAISNMRNKFRTRQICKKRTGRQAIAARPVIKWESFPNHVRHGAARRNERQHVFAVRRHYVEDIGLLRVEHPLDSGAQILLEHDALAFHTKR